MSKNLSRLNITLTTTNQVSILTVCIFKSCNNNLIFEINFLFYTSLIGIFKYNCNQFSLPKYPGI